VTKAWSDISKAEQEEAIAESYLKDEELRQKYPDREFGIGREVPRVIWILETRRLAGGPWQPYAFPWEKNPLDHDSMDCNTPENIQQQVDYWKGCARTREWEHRVTKYVPEGSQ